MRDQGYRPFSCWTVGGFRWSQDNLGDGALSILPLSSRLSGVPGTTALQFLLSEGCLGHPDTPAQDPDPATPTASSSRGLALLPAWLVSESLQTGSDLVVCEEGHVTRVVDRQELPVLEECGPRLGRGSAEVREGPRKPPMLLVPPGVQEHRCLTHTHRGPQEHL